MRLGGRRRQLVLAVSLGVLSCRDELVQTAIRLPDPPPMSGSSGAAFDCLGADPSDQLPAGVVFGEGDTRDAWPLVGSSYRALDGPGLYVKARDTFRVYVNGHLAGQSEAAGASLFVPVSLLPGENVIAVAVASDSGTPAALVLLDELENSYGSGSGWKLSAAPEGDWTALGYDDTGWAAAQELATMSSSSACDPGRAFPDSAVASWIGPELGTIGPIALRTVIRVDPIGFAAGTTGGAASEPRRVQSWQELEALATSDEPATIVLDEGPHDFRRAGAEVEDVEVCPSACVDDPSRTVYGVLVGDATCDQALVPARRDQRVLHLGSNKTVLGLGRGAAIRGVSFDLGASENIIIRNVAIFDINRGLLEADDAFTLSGASRVWIDHATVRWVSDGFVDVLAGTTGVTLSYSFFDGGTDGECRGQETWTSTITDSDVTIHHCRFDQVSTHAPLAVGSLGRVHLFNDVYSNSLAWTLGSSCLAQVRLEGSVFENVEVVSRLSTCSDSNERGLMNAVAGSNIYRDGSAVHIGGDGSEPHDEALVPDYDYLVEPANEAWPRVLLRAGAGGPWALPLVVD